MRGGRRDRGSEQEVQLCLGSPECHCSQSLPRVYRVGERYPGLVPTGGRMLGKLYRKELPESLLGNTGRREDKSSCTKHSPLNNGYHNHK